MSSFGRGILILRFWRGLSFKNEWFCVFSHLEVACKDAEKKKPCISKVFSFWRYLGVIRIDKQRRRGKNLLAQGVTPAPSASKQDACYSS